MDLDTPYPLDDAAVDTYRRDGYVRLTDVLSPPELAHYGDAVTRTVRGMTREKRRRQVERDYDAETAAWFERIFGGERRSAESTYARAFTQMPNLWRYDNVVRALVYSRRLAEIAARLMHVPGVRLYHDQALYKEARGGHTPWHVDQFYWPLSSNNTVTAWIPLQPVPAEMGPVAFAKGSHKMARDSVASELAISDESEAKLAELLTGYPVDARPFELGEVSFHSGWTCHRAGPNDTDETRAAFTIIYMERDIRLIEPRRDNHIADARMWIPGIRPGEVAASPLNPLLYDAMP